MANIYDVGDEIRCTGTFTDADGTAQDPTAVMFAYKDPSGTTTTLTYGTDAALIKSDTGVYYVDLDIDESGIWRYRFYSTGDGQAAGEDYFHAREQEVS